MDTQNIFLIGLMGSGKTTIGQMLAKRIGMPFLDSDHELEQRTGVSIATIFEKPKGSRISCARSGSGLMSPPSGTGLSWVPVVGASLNADTPTALKSRGTTVYLHSSPETSYERVRRNRDRPLLLVSDPLGRLRQLYETRHPYRKRHTTVESCS